MKTFIPPHRRAFVALVPAALLIATPGFAQEAATASPAAAPIQTTVTPPSVVPSLPEASTPAAAPAGEAVTQRNGIGDPNSKTPMAPEALAQAEAARTAANTRAAAARAAHTARSIRQAPARAAPAPIAVAPAPAAAAPAAEVPSSEPVTAAPAPAAAPAQPAAAPQSTDTTQTSTVSESAPVWPWIVGGLVILGGLLAFLLTRRRRVVEEDNYEETYVAPVAHPIVTPVAPTVLAAETPVVAERPQFLRAAPVISPIAAPVVAPLAAAPLTDEPAPAATEDASLEKAEAGDVEALTAGDAPVADRPWLEFAMRPIRAGSNVDEALVEIELTIGNAGNIAAEDVRISTFMFADGSASEAAMERLLVERGDEGIAPVTIEPGEGTRVDATLALLKRDLSDTAEFSPVVMADARYRLPDGSEGRTCATFLIGVTNDDGVHIEPISIARPLMRDDIAAHLHGVPEHA
jgi:hypothetical protein